MTRRVLVDFSHYDDLCGFGEIARNYAPRLAARKVDDIRFIFVLPEKRVGLFGEQRYIISAFTPSGGSGKKEFSVPDGKCIILLPAITLASRYAG